MSIRTRTSGIMIPAYVAPAGFSTSCAASAAFLARATNVTSNTDKQNYDDLICGLNSDGVLAKLDLLYIWAAIDRTTACLNLISASNPCAENGTVNFTPYVGYTGDGGTGDTFYLPTGFNVGAGGTQWTQDEASLGFYVKSQRGSGGNEALGGWDDEITNVNGTKLNPYQFGGIQTFMNGVVRNPPAGVTSTNGFWAIVLSSGTTVSTYNWSTVNSTAGNLDSGGTGVAALPTSTIVTFFAYRNLGSQSQFSSDQMSAAFLGGGLTAGDVLQLARRLNTYMAQYFISQYVQP